MEILKFINESRLENFFSKYSKKFSQDTLTKISKLILPKFLDWVGKNLNTINLDENLTKLVNSLNEFEKFSSNLSKSDLYQYKSVDELNSELEKFRQKQRRIVKKVEGGNVVFENEEYFVVNPLSHKSSCYYGKGTKWCTSADVDSHFTKYNDDGKLFYIIDKKLKTNDPFYKVALLYKFDKGKSWWDAKDISFNKGWIFDSPNYNKIIDSIDEYMNTQYQEQIKIWTDKEEAKKEKLKLEKLRKERRQRQLRNEAEERKLDNEWQLGPNCPIEGLKAHALLNWLVDTSDVEILTIQDETKLQALLDEKSRLELEITQDEEKKQEIIDRIDEIDEEIYDLNEKVDVYDIVPNGNDYYYLDEFEVLKVPSLEDRRYVVGTENETQRSAEEYVENLIDDIGFRGFNKSFVMNFLDLDKIQEEAEEIYYNDVTDNPDVYFDDSQRELSERQEENILILEKKILLLKNQIEKFSELEDLDNKNDEYNITNQIDEIETQIDELENEIEDIKSEPDGDFPSSIVDEKVRELVNEATENPEFYLNNLGLSYENYIDRDEFIDGVIEEDGIGHTLNGYDGNADEVYVQDILFYVMRID